MRKGAMLAVALVVAVACGAASPRGSSLTLVTDSEPGQRLTVRGRVVDENGKPVAAAQLHVYQTDASGRYTPDKPMDESHARLFGSLQTDEDGKFELHTIRPGGCCARRPAFAAGVFLLLSVTAAASFRRPRRGCVG